MTELVGVAATAFQAILIAYDTVKTNKERLSALVKRCEVVVDMLERVVVEHAQLDEETQTQTQTQTRKSERDRKWIQNSDQLRVQRLVQ